MAWLDTNYGPGPGQIASQFNVSSHGGGQYQRRNQWADLIASLAPAIKDYIKQKRNDEIANQLMNMEQPPRAEAVDPSIQGAPATQPFTGGAEGYEAHRLYQDRLEKQEDREYRRNNRPTYNKEGLTPYQARQLEIAREREDRLAGSQDERRRGGGSGYAKTFNSAVGDEGITPDMMAGVDTETPNVVEYRKYVLGPDGKTQVPVKISTEEARELGSSAYAKAQGLPEVPLPKFNRAAEAYRRMVERGQGGRSEKFLPKPKVMGRQTDSAADINRMPSTGRPPDPTMGGPTLDKTPVKVNTKAEYDALPPNASYIAPDGTLRVKQ